MNRITPQLPPQCQLVGCIVESDNPGDLSEDMVEITLPNGVLIHAGWYPDSDPQGQYQISADLGLIKFTTLYTRDANEAAQLLEELTRLFCARLRNAAPIYNSDFAETGVVSGPLVVEDPGSCLSS